MKTPRIGWAKDWDAMQQEEGLPPAARFFRADPPPTLADIERVRENGRQAQRDANNEKARQKREWLKRAKREMEKDKEEERTFDRHLQEQSFSHALRERALEREAEERERWYLNERARMAQVSSEIRRAEWDEYVEKRRQLYMGVIWPELPVAELNRAAKRMGLELH
jgi:hypothetical protein